MVLIEILFHQFLYFKEFFQSFLPTISIRIMAKFISTRNMFRVKPFKLVRSRFKLESRLEYRMTNSVNANVVQFEMRLGAGKRMRTLKNSKTLYSNYDIDPCVVHYNYYCVKYRSRSRPLNHIGLKKKYIYICIYIYIYIYIYINHYSSAW